MCRCVCGYYNSAIKNYKTAISNDKAVGDKKIQLIKNSVGGLLFYFTIFAILQI